MLESYKETCLERYGVDNFFKTDEFKEMMTPEKKKERVDKSNETKRKHNTFNKSKGEKILKEYLVRKYGSTNVITNYTDERYSRKEDGYKFKCDFYIPTEDLFIELNLHPTHGDHPFDETNELDILYLNQLLEESKTSDWALCTVSVWAGLDVEKRKAAKESNLKYEVIYNLDDYIKD